MTGLSAVSTSSQSAGTGSHQIATAAIFWLKNRRPDRWRDVQQFDQAIGHYMISDKAMTEAEWIAARADIAKPVVAAALPGSKDDTGKLLE